MNAKHLGKTLDDNGYAVYLFYEYKGHEYMITDEHNGYSETMRTKHLWEQQRIDDMIAEEEKRKTLPEENKQGFTLDEIFQLMGWD